MALSAPAETDGFALKGKVNGHIFVVNNYTTPTGCQHCGKLLKGVIRQVSVATASVAAQSARAWTGRVCS
jgi:ribosomal protein L34E